jgi:hypothetical protein
MTERCSGGWGGATGFSGSHYQQRTARRRTWCMVWGIRGTRGARQLVCSFDLMRSHRLEAELGCRFRSGPGPAQIYITQVAPCSHRSSAQHSVPLRRLSVSGSLGSCPFARPHLRHAWLRLVHAGPHCGACGARVPPPPSFVSTRGRVSPMTEGHPVACICRHASRARGITSLLPLGAPSGWTLRAHCSAACDLLGVLWGLTDPLGSPHLGTSAPRGVCSYHPHSRYPHGCYRSIPTHPQRLQRSRRPGH